MFQTEIGQRCVYEDNVWLKSRLRGFRVLIVWFPMMNHIINLVDNLHEDILPIFFRINPEYWVKWSPRTDEVTLNDMGKID